MEGDVDRAELVQGSVLDRGDDGFGRDALGAREARDAERAAAPPGEGAELPHTTPAVPPRRRGLGLRYPSSRGWLATRARLSPSHWIAFIAPNVRTRAAAARRGRAEQVNGASLTFTVSSACARAPSPSRAQIMSHGGEDVGA
jgi:hypothetical protein